MNGGAEDRWQEYVRGLAQAFPYPETPDVAGQVRVALRRKGRPGAWRLRLRRRLALAGLLVAVLLAGLLAVPQVRAAVIRVLRIGVIRILQDGPALTPGTPLPPPPQLAGETTLTEAERRAGFRVRLPTHPPDLGVPDSVYVQEMGGPAVILVWMDRGQPERVRLALHQLGPGSFADKVQPPVLEETEVGGEPAAWTEGPYLLQMRSGEIDVARLVTGHVLVWAEGEVTYRLESNLGLEDAVRIAESLE